MFGFILFSHVFSKWFTCIRRQTKPVTVTRFVMQNSIEEKIIKLAGLKKKMYEGALEKKSPEELKQVRWQIMQSIFEM